MALKRAIQNKTEATCDLIGNKIADKIMNVLINWQQNNLEAVINENGKEMPKEQRPKIYALTRKTEIYK